MRDKPQFALRAAEVVIEGVVVAALILGVVRVGRALAMGDRLADPVKVGWVDLESAG